MRMYKWAMKMPVTIVDCGLRRFSLFFPLSIESVIIISEHVGRVDSILRKNHLIVFFSHGLSQMEWACVTSSFHANHLPVFKWDPSLIEKIEKSLS